MDPRFQSHLSGQPGRPDNFGSKRLSRLDTKQGMLIG